MSDSMQDQAAWRRFRRLWGNTAVFRTLSTGASALGAVLEASWPAHSGCPGRPFFLVGTIVVALGPILFHWLSNDRIEATLPTRQPTEEKV
ncbi:hypothetical protein ACQP08_10930 [Micromonospora zamorensis]|uniref:hypothetical protein n=1 Tax=Micromonospora zamorensis TaxID=709883 RepID=UPI003D94E2FE